MSLAFSDAAMRRFEKIVSRYPNKQAALLPVLHLAQEEFGYVPPEAVSDIAAALNLSRAEVHGVISFYHHFRSEPAGRNVMQICRAEACRAMGSERLWTHACGRLSMDAAHADGAATAHGVTSVDGAFTLQPVYCLGLCSSSPAMALNDKVHARVDEDKFDALVAAARSVA